ncbi:MAG: MoaD/ThiS family protein [Anaerolineales bacterium]|nr:MoaD/ThiS family protein [Anaerolineales bacterium]
MPVLRIPTPLRAYTNGQAEITVNGTSISEALTDLTNQYPTIKPHLFNDGGDLRPFVNLFVGEHNIKDLQGVNTPIKDGEKIMLDSVHRGRTHCEELFWSKPSPRSPVFAKPRDGTEANAA